MSSRFYFGGSDSGSDVDDDAPLPFPKPLDRAAFLAPGFNAATFLASLSNRFQTLEDLQTELRDLSNTLNKELVDLVNDNYQDFLSLGTTLSGGEEKIEDIRLGLLGFQREVKAIRDNVDTRRNEVADLLRQKKTLKHDTGIARSLLEIAERLDQLEDKLNTTNFRPTNTLESGDQENPNVAWSKGWTESMSYDSDDEYESDDTSIPPRLKRQVEEFLILKHLISQVSTHHPFILAQDSRIRKLQEILLSDLEAAIKQEPQVKFKQQMLQLRGAVEG
ncbi:hypothetical protein PV08_02520 [Exophiala spinifera]|uniref:Conserved oligomeric Golgi complex subunit 2 n=1 Tax=Exophiala spinifera TaxID=91928 RepID=A0A0D1ZZR8_9EURO|nr:uncharacterized protein PV08_02520 [Exophiala spinifera]KIW18232.1 hypothetical protein PV08_02520 [Exophiala spinifera]